MNRIDYKTSKAPILDGLFDQFAKTGTLNYCMICLRTERRVVKNRNFRKFSAAMKLGKDRWQNNQICYMCERQASNALKFLNAVTFAATIDTIFSEIVYEKRNNSTNVFQESTFNEILKKYGLNSHKSSLLDWDLDLEAIRSTTQFVETVPLIVDNLASEMPKPDCDLTPAAPEQLYVIPDYPPSAGRVTGVAGRCMGVTEFPSIPETGGHDAGASKDDLALMFQSEPNISETLVILEDEEDKPPLQIRIDNVVSNAVKPPQPSQYPRLINLLPKPSKPPPLTLLAPNQTSVLDPKEVYTGDSLLIGTPGGTYTLHPIAIKEGVTTIPSLGAKLINGRLFYDKIPNIAPIITPMDINQLKPNAPGPVLPNNVFAHPNVASPQQLFVNVFEDFSKTTKRESPSVECATPNKMSKGLPVEKECDSEKSCRIDWEDKIPMDVISYMYAVDPLTKKGQIQTTSVRNTLQEGPPDVIDLC